MTLECSTKSDRRLGSRCGFTLLEVVLAIALSAVLLGLLMLAVDQYLVSVQSSRASVEHAQVARGVLKMIADDIRNAATAYEQGISAATALAGSAGGAEADGGESGGEPAGGGAVTDDESTPLGVTGDKTFLQVDVLRVRRALMEQPEEFASGEEPTFAGPPQGSGISSVRYSIAPGGGLVRQQVARDVAVWEERQGIAASWEASRQVVADEVMGIEFRYLAGAEAFDYWDAAEREGESPSAIEVRVTLREPTSQQRASEGETPIRVYRRVVALPRVEAETSSNASDGVDTETI